MTDDTAPKKSEAPKAANTPSEGAAKPDAAKSDTTKSEASAPSNYSRGEGQKPVTQAYKDNWNAIYGKKKEKAPRTRTAKPKATKTKTTKKAAKKTAKKAAVKTRKKSGR